MHVGRERLEFKNGARTDGLRLIHWAKAGTDPDAGLWHPRNPVFYSLTPLPPDYPFEHYNVVSNPYKYTDEEYTELLEGTRRFYDREEVVHVTVDPEWSKEETDYLFKTIEDYDSRFFIVHDRYEFLGGTPRSLEVRVVSRQGLGPPRSELDQGPERQILQYL